MDEKKKNGIFFFVNGDYELMTLFSSTCQFSFSVWINVLRRHTIPNIYAIVYISGFRRVLNLHVIDIRLSNIKKKK